MTIEENTEVNKILDYAKKVNMVAYKVLKKALEQEPCDDAISRQAVLDLVNADWKYEGLEEDVSSLPPVTPQSKMGRWIYKQYGDYPEQGDYHCSECDGIDNRIPAYCPNCGAKMQEAEE